MVHLLENLLRLAQRWLGYRWIVLVVHNGEEASLVRAPGDLPVSVRPNTDGSVGMTVGHEDDGDALLADLRALMS